MANPEVSDPAAPKGDTAGAGAVLRVLEVLRRASRDLQDSPDPGPDSDYSAAMKALLELETESESILSKDPRLSNLSRHLADLRALILDLRSRPPPRGLGLASFLSRRASAHSVSRVAGSIESEIQAWIDRETVAKLIGALSDDNKKKDRGRSDDGGEEELVVGLLAQLERRVSQGFDPDLQDLVLKSKLLLPRLDSVLRDAEGCPRRIREQAAYAVAAFIRFNKDVFVGQVSMAATVRALIAMASPHSLRVLRSLIKSIKSPLVDEVQSNGEIPKIIGFLKYCGDGDDIQLQMEAMECVLEIGYFGRKDAIEAMLDAGLIERLLELQRSSLGGDLIGSGEEEETSQRRFLERRPFASCVARFAVQLEVGEGLRQRERRSLKQRILAGVREASGSDAAEAATIAAEVLWGSSP